VSVEIRMPQWGMAMQEGAVVRWMKEVGERVEVDEPLVEVETAKTTGEVMAPAAGIVTEIRVAVGETVPVQTVLAVIGAASKAAGTDAPVTEVPGDGVSASAAGGQGVQVVPLARKLAREHGVDLGTVQGSGRGGRIVPSDVRAALEAGSNRVENEGAGAVFAASSDGVASEVFATAASSSPSDRLSQREPLRGVRKVIAERMHASLQGSAQLTLMRSVAMDAAVELRGRLVAAWADEGLRPTYTDLTALAAARALRCHPEINSSLLDGADGLELILHAEVNLGVAVSVEGGLLVPVIRSAEGLTLRALSAASADVVRRARAGELGPDEYAGGTFTVSSLGSSGVDWFTPILNPPEAALLGVGRITDTWRSGESGPIAAKAMALSLTIDHRIIDGAVGASFLATLAELLENPLRLLS
jgi:pyruvate dehydrogenase E2 component (dihydrolipoamide acetyltransferase)